MLDMQLHLKNVYHNGINFALLDEFFGKIQSFPFKNKETNRDP